MSVQLSNPTLIINNQNIRVVPNSVTYTEGFGEYSYKNSTAGGSSTEEVFSQNVENALSMVKFEMYADVSNRGVVAMDIIRGWKAGLSNNTIAITDSTSGFSRFFAKAALINDPEIKLGSDTTISLEWKAHQSV